MTRPHIESTLHATYVGLFVEAVAVVLMIGIAVIWIAIGAA